MYPPPPTSTLFPYTTLFRSLLTDPVEAHGKAHIGGGLAFSRGCGRDSGTQHQLTVGPVFHPIENIQMYLRSEEHTSELQSQSNLVCRLLLEKKNILHSIHVF